MFDRKWSYEISNQYYGQKLKGGTNHVGLFIWVIIPRLYILSSSLPLSLSIYPSLLFSIIFGFWRRIKKVSRRKFNRKN